jgi:hypothetical protein
MRIIAFRRSLTGSFLDIRSVPRVFEHNEDSDPEWHRDIAAKTPEAGSDKMSREDRSSWLSAWRTRAVQTAPLPPLLVPVAVVVVEPARAINCRACTPPVDFDLVTCNS